MTADMLPGLVTREELVPAVPLGEEGIQAAAGTTARVIGLDLSLVATGMSDGSRTWVVRSAGKKGDSLHSRWERLRTIGLEVCLAVHPETDLVLIEGPAFGSRDGHAHDRSGLWWLIVSSLHKSAVPVLEVSPSTLKKYATGKGNASKHEVIYATAKRFPDIEIGGDDNRADALWLAAIGLDVLSGAHVVPDSHRGVLAKLPPLTRRTA